MKAFARMRHPHASMNANAQHKKEQEAAGINAQIAVSLTRIVGTMETAYVFAGLAVVGLLAILGILNPLTALLVAWTSQTLIQLTLLPIIMVGQNVQGQHQEIQAEEMYKATINSYHDIEQMQQHLDMQDQIILQILTAMQEFTGKKRAV